MAKKALGRGLKALIPETPRARAGFAELGIEHLHPNPRQPRKHFDSEALEQLAASIREHGILQPLLVSEDESGGYLILAGERRWRAASRAGLERLPVVIRERIDDERELEMALVENLQRRDLMPMEEARAFDILRREQGLSQAEIATKVGFDRSTIANSLRLMKLPRDIQEMLESGTLSAGHARALLSLPEERQRQLAEQVLQEALSVRQLEKRCSEIRKGESVPVRKKRPPRDPNLVDAEKNLSDRLGVAVRIDSGGRGGKITLRCPDRKELMRVYEALMGGEEW